jgi:hypothetical protein
MDVRVSTKLRPRYDVANKVCACGCRGKGEARASKRAVDDTGGETLVSVPAEV